MSAKGSAKGGGVGFLLLALVVACLSTTGKFPSLSDLADAASTATSGAPAPSVSVPAPGDVAVPAPSARVPAYSRAAFGPAWKDVDRNGCDTRNDVLRASLRDVVFRKGSTCVVESGVLPVDPYTGEKNVTWRRGAVTSSALQVDHVVPLKWAWENGAASWTQERREAFANDRELVLLLADGPENGAKGAQGPSTWNVPGNPGYRCEYNRRFLAVVTHYKLTMPAADAEAVRTSLEACS